MSARPQPGPATRRTLALSGAVRRALPLVLATTALGAAATPAHAVAPSWRLEQPTLPGANTRGPLGPPAGIAFRTPNTGVLQTQGTGSLPAGLWFYDGAGWRQLSTVCGATGDRGGVAWGGPHELWAIADPVPNPFDPAATGALDDRGSTLCHIEDGEVAASYAVQPSEPGRYFPMDAAACLNAGDCTFAGEFGAAPDGSRAGAFALHWDGHDVQLAYDPQGRGASDLEPYAGALWRSAVQGAGPGYAVPAPLTTPEPSARLLAERDAAGAFHPDLFTPPAAGALPITADPLQPPLDSTPADLLALGARDGELWTVGAGASSGDIWGQSPVRCGPDDRNRTAINAILPPVGVKLDDGPMVAGRFSSADAALLAPLDNGFFSAPSVWELGDVAPIPGSPHEAWATLRLHRPAPCPAARGASELATYRDAALVPRVVRLRFLPDAPASEPNLQIEELSELPSGAGRGAAWRIACPAAGDCWAVTASGWLYHWSDGTQPPRNDDPAFAQTITQRPPDARTPQLVPDAPPNDDSERFRPPPIFVDPPPAPASAPRAKVHVKRRGPLIRRVRARALGPRRLVVRFVLTRPARVQLVAELRGRVLAHSPQRRLAPGPAQLTLTLPRRFRPSRVRFRAHELASATPSRHR
jgi:hypothetical protein